MSKEQSLPANIQEQIEREYRNRDLEHPDGSIEFMKTSDKLFNTQLQAAALRGAEIALENQWVLVEDVEIEPVAPYWVACEDGSRWIAYNMSDGWFWYHNDAVITGKVTHVIRLTTPTPPKP